jgi:hypothetical protein
MRDRSAKVFLRARILFIYRKFEKSTDSLIYQRVTMRPDPLIVFGPKP